MFKVNILHGWLGVENEGVFNENAISEIEKNAKEGDEDAKIKLAALNAEKGENFEENFSFLETLHAEGNEMASLFIGVLYHEGVVEKDADGKEKVLLSENHQKSEEYLKKLDSHKWPMVALIFGMNSYFDCCIYGRDVNFGEDPDCEKTSAEEYIEGEKRLLSLYEIAKENKNEDWQNMAKTWLSSLYEVKGSPVYDLEKSKYWKEKECLA